MRKKAFGGAMYVVLGVMFFSIGMGSIHAGNGCGVPATPKCHGADCTRVEY